MMNIEIISGACCAPNMAAIDRELQKVIEKLLSETGTEAMISVLTISGILKNPNKKFIGKLIDDYSKSLIKLPAIVIDDEIISYGVPDRETIFNAIQKHTNIDLLKEGKV